MEVEEVFSGDEDSDFELDENVLRELYKADNTSDKAKPNSIKDELRTKIQQRRISEGQEELKVVFEPPKSYELTPEEREKIQRRKRRNRLSANQSRINRQRKLENLIKDETKLTAENHKLKTEVDALMKFKVKLETVLQNHVVDRCNRKDDTNPGYFTNLLQDATPVDVSTEGSTMLSRSSAVLDANAPFYSVKHCSVDGDPQYGTAHGSATNADQPAAHVDNSRLPLYKETGRSGGVPLMNNEQTPNLRLLNRTNLRTMSKEQKILMLKAYLKGDQTKPEAQKIIGQIRQMIRTEQCMQTV